MSAQILGRQQTAQTGNEAEDNRKKSSKSDSAVHTKVKQPGSEATGSDNQAFYAPQLPPFDCENCK